CQETEKNTLSGVARIDLGWSQPGELDPCTGTAGSYILFP
ncbi:unnamed protein product, partial [marine sediment metagenome]